MTAPPIITLTTDFGLQDAYVGVMKGVMLGIEPGTRLIDLTHQIEPQNVAQGAFILESAYRYFPPGTVHLAVVDPGVGTARKAVAIATEHGVFIGPDNGLFTRVLMDQGLVSVEDGTIRGAIAVELSNPAYRLPDVSSTFHGRDIFAPAAAFVSQGVPPIELGQPLDRVVLLPSSRRVETMDAGLTGIVQHIDRFGNAILTLRLQDLPRYPEFQVAGHHITTVSTSYEDASLAVLVGSSGYLEVAVRNGSAAQTLHLTIGDVVSVKGRA